MMADTAARRQVLSSIFADILAKDVGKVLAGPDGTCAHVRVNNRSKMHSNSDSNSNDVRNNGD